MFQSKVYYNFNVSANSPNTQFTINSTFLDQGLTSLLIHWENCVMDLAVEEYPLKISEDGGVTINSLMNQTNDSIRYTVLTEQ